MTEEQMRKLRYQVMKLYKEKKKQELIFDDKLLNEVLSSLSYESMINLKANVNEGRINFSNLNTETLLEIIDENIISYSKL